MEQEESGKEIVLTYETLFEYLRKEKSQDEIQELPHTFFKDLTKYLAQRRQQLEKPDLDKFMEKGKVNSQTENAVRIVREIYDRREKKIIMLAVNKARTSSNIIDTTNLLPEEKKMFDALVEELVKFREGIVNCVLTGQKPEICSEEAYDRPEPAEEEPENKKVHFLESVPKFVGKELEVYGPFEANDTAELPPDVADLLIRKGRAKAV